MLSILLNADAKIPQESATNLPLTFAKERASHLVSLLSKVRRKVILPAPACAELLAVIGPDARQYPDVVSQTRFFEIISFDNKCTIELAMLNRTVFFDNDRKKTEPDQKIKFDRQIIAIYEVSGVSEIYSDDSGVAARAVCVDDRHSYMQPPHTSI
jgi:hypothetical protein